MADDCIVRLVDGRAIAYGVWEHWRHSRPGFFYPRYGIVNQTHSQFTPGVYDEPSMYSAHA